ncbi:MAG: DMT family transporter [Verrucomicrobiota bacterium]
MSNLNRPVLFLVLASVLWSTGGLLIKSIAWNALAIAGARSAIAAGVVYLLMPRPRFTFSAAQLGAAVCYAATVILFVLANKMTTAANAIFLQYTAPIYIALFGAWFLKEHPTRLDWALIALAQVGIGLFFLDRLTFQGVWGNVSALASGLAFAGLILLLRQQKDGSPVESVLLGNLLTALVCLPFALNSSPAAGSWVGLVLLGVFQLGLSYVLYATAIKQVRALEAVLISTIEPVLNPLWVLVFLGEKPQAWALAGGVLVLTAATVRRVSTAWRLKQQAAS